MRSGDPKQKVKNAFEGDLGLLTHANPTRDSLGRQVDGADKRDNRGLLEPGESQVAYRQGRLGSEAVMPEGAMKEVTDFWFGIAVDILDGETDLTDGHCRSLRDDEPEPVAVVGIALELSVEPHLRFGAAERVGIESHHLRISQHLGEKVEIVRDEFTEKQTFGFGDSVHRRNVNDNNHPVTTTR